MKKILTFIFLFFALFYSIAQNTKTALFIGNSYTSVNNLPQLVKNLATADGNILIYDSHTPGGRQLIQHSSDVVVHQKIKQRAWNYTVLQEQSQKPSFPPAQVATDVKPYASILNDSIKSNNACTQTLFYMTWGRQNGDQGNCANYPPLCTYAGMQQRLRESYLEMAQDNNASVAPVGMAWKTVRENHPTINLYTSDGSHPNINGSYLAACVFYSSMFHKSSVGNTYRASIDSTTAYILQSIASATVFDSLTLWQIDTTASNVVYLDSSIVACGSAVVNNDTFTSSTSFSDTISHTVACKDTIIRYDIVVSPTPSIEYFSQAMLLGGSSFGSIHFSWAVNHFDSLIIMEGIDTVLVYQKNQTSTVPFYHCTDSAGSRIFTMYAYNDCGVDSLTEGLVCDRGTGIPIIASHLFSISPNPAQDVVQVKSTRQQKFSAKLIDIQGKETSPLQESENQQIEMKIATINKGIYFLLLFDENASPLGQQKLLIE